MGAIEISEKSQLMDRPAMKSGDTVRVHVKVREGDKERIQMFEGVVIGMHRGGTKASFTVRKVSFGRAWSVFSRCIRPRFRRSTSCVRPRSAARSSTTCAT